MAPKNKNRPLRAIRLREFHEEPLIDAEALKTALNDLAGGMDFEPDKARPKALELVKQAMDQGRQMARERLEAGEVDGMTTARDLSVLQDIIIRLLHDYTVEHVFPLHNPTDAERLSVIAVGGYGRAALAPGSDIDLLFVRPYKKTSWSENVLEYLLYFLWDLGQKVGHATRSIDECVSMSKRDMTIRTSILEARYVWGDKGLFEELLKNFKSQIVASGDGHDFVEAKLAERDERHRRSGESRYLVEPNLKDGKGGLRDLHTLFWIGKYLYQVEHSSELVGHGVYTPSEYEKFSKAEAYFWTVRCHLHFLTGRAEERLSFDVQPELAKRLGYTSHGGLRDVERFMKHYFLMAKRVGDLTRIFCAGLEVGNLKKRPSWSKILPNFGRRQKFGDFVLDGGRISTLDNKVFEKDPVNLLRLFQLADEHEVFIHPDALRLVTRSLRLIDDDLRANEEANRIFLDVLCSRKDPEATLRRMNEAGVLGRFIPDFGKIVAMMQFNMYHHYTVDEHLIRAIGILASIERRELGSEHPLADELVTKIRSRETLYMAVLLHDMAKGREKDHSEEGEEIARDLCPRLGMSSAATETVAWLVRNHLLMSDCAQRRDISDPKTVQDFADQVQSPERLRLLLILTVADIKAVGPGVWNGWKGQLLRELYFETESVLQGGHSTVTRKERVANAQHLLEERLTNWSPEDRNAALTRHYDPYWLSLDTDAHEKHAAWIREAEATNALLTIKTEPDAFQAATEVTVYTADHPGLFSRLAGAFAVASANITSAKVFTTNQGMALDVFTVQDPDGKAFDDESRLNRLKKTIEKTLRGDLKAHEVIADKKAARRQRAFTVESEVLIDNSASDTYTVIEVNGRDRPGLLHDLTRALFSLSLTIGAARIATYGERAVDVFYVKDGYGLKILHDQRLAKIEETILESLSPKKKPLTTRKKGSKKAAE